ncbi:hypothetical protein Q8W71_23775 [Methylobacterium sp. NEAU 140]|nr:hypothetical protein [Methylobacterium sp. NEAU 140]MDP4025658.1 hypothetical protein [Methylobacterium sp. NEAU 140]
MMTVDRTWTGLVREFNLQAGFLVPAIDRGIGGARLPIAAASDRW